MKIALYVSQLSAGGAEQVAVLLADGLIELKHDVIIIAASLQGKFLTRLNSKCKIIDLSSRKPIQALHILSKSIHSVNPDAVICFGITPGIAATLSKAIFHWGQPIFVRIENNIEADWRCANAHNKFIGPILSRWVARKCSIISVSHSLALATANYLRRPLPKITTILNPVLGKFQSNSFQEDKNPSSNLHSWLKDKSTPAIIAIGRLEYQKGFDILIEAFVRVRATKKARLIIFGEGSMRQNLAIQIQRANLQDAIDLAGFTNTPMEQMCAAHAFVLSSRFEGFGLVLVEALRSGTNVISTDCPYGPAELLENGRYGTLAPVEDAEALAAAMIDSLDGKIANERPSDEWFNQFTAVEAARQHVTLINATLRRNAAKAE